MSINNTTNAESSVMAEVKTISDEASNINSLSEMTLLPAPLMDNEKLTDKISSIKQVNMI